MNTRNETPMRAQARRRPATIATGFVATICILAWSGGCGLFQAPLAVVESVDIERYAGKWYEIARYPNTFERNCVGVTAEYSLRDDGKISVLNTCYEETLDGAMRTIEGSARTVDATNAKLKVSFFGPFEGDYWILDLDEDYTYAVVGAPNRRFLWILSRTPELDEDLLDEIREWLPSLGFDPDRLIMVEQDVDGLNAG